MDCAERVVVRSEHFAAAWYRRDVTPRQLPGMNASLQSCLMPPRDQYHHPHARRIDLLIMSLSPFAALNFMQYRDYCRYTAVRK